jgi:hypothetical protein
MIEICLFETDPNEYSDSFFYDDPKLIFSMQLKQHLAKIARETGLYYFLFEPEYFNFTRSKDIVEGIRQGIRYLVLYPTRCKKWDGHCNDETYEYFLPLMCRYYEALKRNPDGYIYTIH